MATLIKWKWNSCQCRWLHYLNKQEFFYYANGHIRALHWQTRHLDYADETPCEYRYRPHYIDKQDTLSIQLTMLYWQTRHCQSMHIILRSKIICQYKWQRYIGKQFQLKMLYWQTDTLPMQTRLYWQTIQLTTSHWQTRDSANAEHVILTNKTLCHCNWPC